MQHAGGLLNFERLLGADNLEPQQVFARGNRQDLAALCLVSRRVNAAATPWLYRSIILNSTTAKDHLSCFVNNSNANLHLVRDFTMQGVDSSTEFTELGKLVDMLPHISNIDRFQFVSPQQFLHQYADDNGVAGSQQSHAWTP